MMKKGHRIFYSNIIVGIFLASKYAYTIKQCNQTHPYIFENDCLELCPLNTLYKFDSCQKKSGCLTQKIQNQKFICEACSDNSKFLFNSQFGFCLPKQGIFVSQYKLDNKDEILVGKLRKIEFGINCFIDGKVISMKELEHKYVLQLTLKEISILNPKDSNPFSKTLINRKITKDELENEVVSFKGEFLQFGGKKYASIISIKDQGSYCVIRFQISS